MSAENLATLTAPQARRLRWLVPLVLAIAALAGWTGSPYVTREPAPRPEPAPVFGASDGLPAELISGGVYTATVTVTFPAGWEDNGVVVVTGRAVPEEFTHEMDGVIFCSSGLEAPAGRAHTLSCEITAPSPGPFTLHAEIGLLGGHGGRDYQHTIVARQ